MKWKAIITRPDTGISRLRIDASEGSGILFGEFFQLCENPDFSDFVSRTLLEINQVGFFWELPPITDQCLEQPFECVVVPSDILPGLTANSTRFGNQFAEARSNESVVSFENLGGDAFLIVPVPIMPDHGAYAHLATFLREGPGEQIRDFWAATGRTALARVSQEPYWLNTAGLGVSWLHLRFDAGPKYYRYQPYKEFS